MISRLAKAPVLALGFRPFYLLAGMFATFALPVWILSYVGILRIDANPISVAWHGHEIVFGFAAAVIAGFLLTAVRNWTGRATPTGVPLACLGALWLAGRVLAPGGPGAVAALIDVAFLPALGLALAVPIWRSANMRNFKILIVIAGLTICNATYHLADLQILPGGLARASITLALDLITILMAIVGGRVIPAFTANAIPDAQPRHHRVVEIVAVGALVVILLGDVIDIGVLVPTAVWIAVLASAALAQLIRLLLWQPHRTIRDPLLAMLPIAYVWIPVSLALRAFAHAASIPPVAAVHALTIGAIGGLTTAMMMRSALGHTGRPLAAAPADIAVFALVQLAAILRVAGAIVFPEHYRASVVASGILWTLAFAVFVLRYWPLLTRPRVDGKPG